MSEDTMSVSTATLRRATLRWATLHRAAALAGLLLLCSTSPALANNELSLRISTNWMVDDGNSATDTDNVMVQAEFSYARALLSAGPGKIWGEISWTIGRSKAALFDETFESSTLLQSFTLGARYTFPILYWLVAHTRAGLGVGLAHYSLDLGERARGSAVLEAGGDVSAALTGYWLAGVEILLPQKWLERGRSGVTGGIVIEAGLTFSTTHRFIVTPERDGERISSPLGGTDVGGLDPTAPVLRIGAVLRF